jgi:hypothetical protein
MIVNGQKTVKGRCWYLCSGIFLEERSADKATYITHERDDWKTLYVGNTVSREASTIEKKKSFLKEALENKKKFKIDFKMYIKEASLEWSEFAKGLIASINGGYVGLKANRCIKIIEEGQGIWKVNFTAKGSEFVQLSPRWKQGRLLDGSFPGTSNISGFSFVENPTNSSDPYYELSIKDVGEVSNVNYKNLFVIKVGVKGPQANEKANAYLANECEPFRKEVLKVLETEINFSKCTASLGLMERVSLTAEKKKQWQRFLEILRDAKMISLDAHKEME